MPDIFEKDGSLCVEINGQLYGNKGTGKKSRHVLETLIRDGWFPISDPPLFERAFKCAYCGKVSLIACSVEPPEHMSVKKTAAFVEEFGRACSCRG